MDLIRLPRRKSAPKETPPPAVPPSAPYQVDLPPWDRAVDVVCHSRKTSDSGPNPVDVFSASLDLVLARNDRKRCQTGYMYLPDKLRFKICQHLIAEHLPSKPITLSRAFARRNAWPETSFTTLKAVLAPLQSYLTISPSFRADLLTTLFSEAHFHTVFSPYVGPRTSPLATTWFLRYAPLMQNIILEVDMTCLGLSAEIGAEKMKPGLAKVENLLRRFGEGQQGRVVPVRELILICRRYHGNRGDRQQAPVPENVSAIKDRRKSRADTFQIPKSTKRTRQSSLPITHISAPIIQTPELPLKKSTQKTSATYCPDIHLEIWDHIAHLKEQVQSLRNCGFSEAYTKEIVATLFPGEDGRCVYRVTPSGAWPRLDGQRALIDLGGGQVVIEHFAASPDRTAPFAGSVIPPAPATLPNGRLYLSGHGLPFTSQEITSRDVSDPGRLLAAGQKALSGKVDDTPGATLTQEELIRIRSVLTIYGVKVKSRAQASL